MRPALSAGCVSGGPVTRPCHPRHSQVRRIHSWSLVSRSEKGPSTSFLRCYTWGSRGPRWGGDIAEDLMAGKLAESARRQISYLCTAVCNSRLSCPVPCIFLDTLNKTAVMLSFLTQGHRCSRTQSVRGYIARTLRKAVWQCRSKLLK